jgi:NitT/TauT family transport system substrate-binding protein
MKHARLALLFFWLLFGLAAWPQSSDARIVVGISSVNVAFLPLYVAQEKGFFKDEGLDVLLVMFNAGNTNLQALVGGDVQIMAGAVAETVLGRSQGVDVKNFWGISNIMPFQMYSQPDLKSLKDAKGKKFAISRFGSLTDFLTRSTLLRFGIDPKEVTILQIGSTPARYAALTAKAVDATLMWFPVSARAKGQGYRMLFDLKEMYPDWPYEAFAAREPWLAAERQQATKFLRAYQRGVRHTRENRDDAVAALRKYVKIDPADAPAGYAEYRDSFPVDGKISERGVTIVAEQEFEQGRAKRKITVDDMIDRSFMSALAGK